jgi:dolichol-phosphate mannosyltransferase
MKYNKLSIIIPVYNEEKTFRELLDKVNNIDLRELKLKKEIIIVDDCSTDKTKEILKNLLALKKYKIILKKKNKGKGHTIKLGLKHATGDINIIQDADLEYEPKDYPKLLKPILKNKTKVVYGSRFINKHNSNWAVPTHYIGNRGLSFITSMLFFQWITDMETCYKCFTKEVKEDLFKKMKFNPKRFDLEPEITAKICKLGYKIKEVPINYYPRDFSEGKKISWKDGVKAFFYLIKYRIVN